MVGARQKSRRRGQMTDGGPQLPLRQPRSSGFYLII